MIETYHLYSRHFGPQLFSSSFEFLAYNMSYFNKNVASKSNIQHISEYKALSIKQIQNFQNTKHLSNIINITHPLLEPQAPVAGPPPWRGSWH